jgi:hypothetical protein
MADFWDEILEGASTFGNYLTNTGSGGALEDVGSAFQTDGKIDYSKIAGGIGGLTSLLGSTGIIPKDSALAKFLGTGGQEKTGFQGKIPDYTASRMQVPGSYDPNRRPGSSGQRYFTDVDYSGGDTSGAAAALQKANLNNPARVNNSVGNAIAAAAPAPMQNAAQGGIMGLAAGGLPSMAQPMNNMTQPRYLQGPMDGMADTIPASIDGKDPAALSGGEFVVPADIVSGLGNGNSDAGAKNLYEMMDRIRQARTGMKKQPPPIDPNQMLPTARV